MKKLNIFGIYILVIMLMCTCSSDSKEQNNKVSLPQPPPKNSLPMNISQAIDSKFGTWYTSGVIEVSVPFCGKLELITASDGTLQAPNETRFRMLKEITIDGHTLSLGTWLEKTNKWWTIVNKLENFDNKSVHEHSSSNYNVEITMHEKQNDTLVYKFTLKPGESINIESGINLTLLEFDPECDIQGQITSVATLFIKYNGKSNKRRLFLSQPNFDKMNDDFYYYKIGKAEKVKKD